MLRGWRQSEFCWSFSICGWLQNGWDGSFQWGYQESWIQLKWQFLPFFSSNVFPTQNGEILKLGPLAIWDSSIICNFSATAPPYFILSGSILKSISMTIYLALVSTRNHKNPPKFTRSTRTHWNVDEKCRELQQCHWPDNVLTQPRWFPA